DERVERAERRLDAERVEKGKPPALPHRDREALAVAVRVGGDDQPTALARRAVRTLRVREMVVDEDDRRRAQSPRKAAAHDRRRERALEAPHPLLGAGAGQTEAIAVEVPQAVDRMPRPMEAG